MTPFAVYEGNSHKLYQCQPTPAQSAVSFGSANGINEVRFISIVKVPYQVSLKAPCSHRMYPAMNRALYLPTSIIISRTILLSEF
jgi:hypothetical protein